MGLGEAFKKVSKAMVLSPVPIGPNQKQLIQYQIEIQDQLGLGLTLKSHFKNLILKISF